MRSEKTVLKQAGADKVCASKGQPPKFIRQRRQVNHTRLLVELDFRNRRRVANKIEADNSLRFPLRHGKRQPLTRSDMFSCSSMTSSRLEIISDH
jgi:hypothetical protein